MSSETEGWDERSVVYIVHFRPRDSILVLVSVLEVSLCVQS